MEDVTPERWLPVLGFEGFYEVSDLGRVRSLPRIAINGARHRGRVLRPARVGHMGYLSVVMTNGPLRKCRAVHLLVAEAFMNVQMGATEIRHRDRDASNAALKNLHPQPRPEYSPIPGSVIARNQVFGNYRNGARQRRLAWELTGEQFDQLTSGNCQYCGCPPSKVKRHSRGEFVYNGIDRVDNTLGYTMDNVVTCCSICNHAKKDMSRDDFLAWIVRVARFQDLEALEQEIKTIRYRRDALADEAVDRLGSGADAPERHPVRRKRRKRPASGHEQAVMETLF